MKFFIVIDMQNDFLTGSLANPEAVKILPNIVERVKKYRDDGYTIVFTRDTHYDNYMSTGEGKHLPVSHCIIESDGWKIAKELTPQDDDVIINKEHFGYDAWTEYIEPGDEVVICGTVTSICVCANFSAIKMIENVEVTVLKNCCADLSNEMQDAALKVMAAQQGIIK